MDDDTDVGPLATEQGRDDVERAGRRRGRPRAPGARAAARARRARLVLPADRAHRHHRRRCAMYTEEVFGPVAALFRVPRHRRGDRSSPTTPTFGLGANAWTDDADERERFVRDLDAGHGLRQRHDDLATRELPFGGVKQLRLRPGAVRPRHPRVLQHQVSVLDRLARARPEDRARPPRPCARSGNVPKTTESPGSCASRASARTPAGGYRLLVLFVRLLRRSCDALRRVRSRVMPPG